MNQSYLQAIDATLDALGVEPARITQFSGQLQQALRFVHLHGPAEGVDQLTRALKGESSGLSNAFTEGVPLSSPAISALAGFGSLNAAALGLPPVARPPLAGVPTLAQLSAIQSQLPNVTNFASTLPMSSQSVQVQVAADALRDRIKEAAKAPNPGLTGHTRDILKKGSKLAHTLLDTADRLRPGKSVCHKEEHASVVTETHEFTSIVTRTHVHTISAVRQYIA